MKNKITMVIATKNRPEKLKRVLAYNKLHNYYDIIVADQSDDKHTYVEILKKTFDNIKTPYAVLCGDDDFIVPESVMHCVTFLEFNPDYSSSRGNCIAFIDTKPITYYPIYLNTVGYDNNSKASMLRYEKLFQGYVSQYYSVHRTETLKEVFDICHNKIDNFNLIEYLIAIKALEKGKYKVLPVFYSVREKIKGSLGEVTDRWDVLSTDSRYEKQYNYFINSIEKIPFEIVEPYINSIIKAKKSSTKKKLIHMIPDKIRRIGRNYFNYIITKDKIGFPFDNNKSSAKLKIIEGFI